MDDAGTIPSERAGKQSILVVDDEENYLSLLCWFLTNRGYEVHTASNGGKAQRLMEAKAYELALIDVRMVPIDGLSLLSDFKRRSPLTKVVMMTAYPTVVAIKQSFENGASGFLTKPVDLQDLLRTLHGLI